MTAISAIPRVTALAGAVPDSPCEASYRQWALAALGPGHDAALFERMHDRSGIGERYSVLSARDTALVPGSFYAGNAPPSTAARMEIYAREAPELALKAVAGLGELGDVTHLVLATCTGFMAPGLDQVLARRLGLPPSVERVVVGFMGCYAGVTALRTAGHIVRSQPQARVLVVAVELCTLHLQPTRDLSRLLAMSQFADGAAAALVTAEGGGLALGESLSLTLEDSADLITWTVGDTGFAMELSGEVPGRLATALADPAVAEAIHPAGEPVEAWAIHPGGRSILDAVERGLALASDKLVASRQVLTSFGNMSSATVLFVMRQLIDQRPASGLALAFGPGLAMEGLRFGWIEGNA